MSKPLIIDLFSGCGGFSIGFHQAGFKTFLSADNDQASCESFKNMSKESIVMNADITSQKFKENLGSLLRNEEIPIDGVIAGLPCQSYSSVGKAQDKNSMQFDKRNFFYKDFFQCLELIKPKFFIFENVSGILSARPNGKRIFEDIITKAKKLNFSIMDDRNTVLLNSADFGVPQIRKRVFIIGINNDLGLDVSKIYQKITARKKFGSRQDYLTVKDAISDLPKIKPGEGEEKILFKPSKRNSYLKNIRKWNQKYLFNHVARNHNYKDKERYAILAEIKGELRDLQKIRPDLIHHNPQHFKNRYTVQRFDQPGKTVVSHLYKDGNLFIHPDSSQTRTFTVREAARIQSFPDSFIFKGSRTEQFKQVGNAVPPILAKNIAMVIKKELKL